jgi:hypothetical protein
MLRYRHLQMKSILQQIDRVNTHQKIYTVRFFIKDALRNYMNTIFFRFLKYKPKSK